MSSMDFHKMGDSLAIDEHDPQQERSHFIHITVALNRSVIVSQKARLLWWRRTLRSDAR